MTHATLSAAPRAQDLGINSADALKDTISLIFDKAIWEPTFCPLYAEMCVGLSKALPEFPPLEGEDKPLTFRRVLLNTCQARAPHVPTSARTHSMC